MKMDRGHHPAQSHDTTVASLHEYTYTWIIHMDHTHGSYTWVGAVCQMRALFLGRSLPVSSASERARAIASCSSSENPPPRLLQLAQEQPPLLRQLASPSGSPGRSQRGPTCSIADPR